MEIFENAEIIGKKTLPLTNRKTTYISLQSMIGIDTHGSPRKTMNMHAKHDYDGCKGQHTKLQWLNANIVHTLTKMCFSCHSE